MLSNVFIVLLLQSETPLVIIKASKQRLQISYVQKILVRSAGMVQREQVYLGGVCKKFGLASFES
jgi:hypothetical protein